MEFYMPRKKKSVKYNEALVGAVQDTFFKNHGMSAASMSNERRKRGFVTVFENIIKIAFFNLKELVDEKGDINDFVELIKPSLIQDTRTATAVKKGSIKEEELNVNVELIRSLKYFPHCVNNNKVKKSACETNGVFVEIVESILEWSKSSRNKAWAEFFEYYAKGDIESAVAAIPESDQIVQRLKGEDDKGEKKKARKTKAKSTKAKATKAPKKSRSKKSESKAAAKEAKEEAKTKKKSTKKAAKEVKAAAKEKAAKPRKTKQRTATCRQKVAPEAAPAPVAAVPVAAAPAEPISVKIYRVVMSKNNKDTEYYISTTTLENAMSAVTQSINSGKFKGEFSGMTPVGEGVHL
jgi:chemotaxis protein histidine kinase CheA